LSPDFPRRPRTAKGAIVALTPISRNPIIDPNTPTLIFQYNPESVIHTFSSADSVFFQAEDGIRDSNILSKPTKEGKNGGRSILELITLTLDFDVAYQLEEPEKNIRVVENGLHPALAVLESIMLSQFKTGGILAPVIVFLFGLNRTLPVWLDSFKVIEEAFDTNLNPTRAKIELVMKVRHLSEFKIGSIGYAICQSHLKRRRFLSELIPQNGYKSSLITHLMNSTR